MILELDSHKAKSVLDALVLSLSSHEVLIEYVQGQNPAPQSYFINIYRLMNKHALFSTTGMLGGRLSSTKVVLHANSSWVWRHHNTQDRFETGTTLHPSTTLTPLARPRSSKNQSSMLTRVYDERILFILFSLLAVAVRISLSGSQN